MLTTITMGAVLISSFVSSTAGLYEGGEVATTSARQRTWGIGTALGGGIVGGVGNVETGFGARSAGGSAPALQLPSLELQFFRDNGHSIDVSIPLTNLLLVNALGGYGGSIETIGGGAVAEIGFTYYGTK